MFQEDTPLLNKSLQFQGVNTFLLISPGFVKLKSATNNDSPVNNLISLLERQSAIVNHKYIYIYIYFLWTLTERVYSQLPVRLLDKRRFTR